ncbi:hypothetical protein FOXG_06944 [Fusarium oxysporum f. sp. lycopersici 4287]|uniref:Uncharacterized protein n=2 Tax=Fusarium oxysporum TaxID=5507 RepID=A0A0J9V0Z5_FUSO4|nr:hypothetical protein FOXG_06944 [Fusarium oxysporum f. sp. lycopersici 4287]XP_018243041.1 hypothetical protein FOXG_06944 [Fusarium oxysporum f. sp. lycopersici 4287]KAJ9412407.1 hypothetical protein QL093DRAFT_2552875 [Fusarium oxysporum]KNB04995.1 hypothetical protein FOXG_06944 [Fusarium oxysporum f. sp. lycopersici 4287]KNB04996.1 hypothetical protein FOXG_06944 [Fusarium oxysporum f. sp. lycopersici 4287]
MGLLALGLSQLLTQRGERRASRQQEQTYQEVRDALPQLLNGIQAREIRVVPNAFNSTPTFLAYFEAAALGSISLVLLDVASAIRRVGASLDAIRSELEIANVARVQGWGHGGFGAYVHRFVQNEMAAVDGTQDGQHHFFYVWHPDSDWYPAFEGRQAEDPLGPAFGGYHHDLATICLRMRADREALIATTDYRRAAVFHLVIPAYYPLVMDHPIAFADELLPLVITGGRYRGADLVWFAIRRDPREERLHLNFVGLLPQNQGNLAMTGGYVGFVGSLLGAVGCSVTATAFPPCAPIAGIVIESFIASALASWTSMASGTVYDVLTQESIQILGDPIFLE